MQTGRPSNKKRPPFGERLHALREQAGLSQQQIAEALGLTQRAYAYWERNPVALRPEQLVKLGEILGVSVEELLNGDGKKSRRGGPTGKMRRVFDEVSALPRSRQQRIVAVVEDMLTAAHQTAS
ncbi:MAG: helix-turn-helix transcriptional regulator [Planctomycetes bacterium]|nr:helix-turn-helix transcriptional regulator [Planctomycetota bacterium]